MIRRRGHGAAGGGGDSGGRPKNSKTATTNPNHHIDDIGTSTTATVLHNTLEQDLVENVCKWMRRVFTMGPGIATILHFSKGHSPYTYIMPCIVSQTALWLGYSGLRAKQQVATLVVVIVPTILSIILQEGCTTSIKPAVFGIFPSACAFIFRTPVAVKLCTLGVLLATLVVFALDATGQCPTQPLVPQDIPSLVGDRLLPLIMLLCGNCALLLAIVKQSQTALQVQTQAALSAEELASIRQDVLHRLTHELRTPLNGIVGSVDLLVSSPILQLPQQAEDLENALTIQRCLDTMLRICNDTLAAAAGNNANNRTGSRHDHGKQPASRGTAPAPAQPLPPIPLVSFLDKVTDVFAASAAAKGLFLKTEFGGNTTSMVINDNTAIGTPIREMELTQVLLNLVGNSIKFTETGSITLRIQESATNTTTAATNSSIGDSSEHGERNSIAPTRVTFEVEDTGVGAASETAHLLFEPFHQGEHGSAVTRRHLGTGLGLSICRELVKKMGGTLQVETAIGKGARFYFSLDLNLQYDRPHQPRQETNTANSRTRQMTQDQSGASSAMGNFEDVRQIHVAILDSQRESRVSCQSMVKSIAPQNTFIHFVESPTEVLDLSTKNESSTAFSPNANDKGRPSKLCRVAFMEATQRDNIDRTNLLLSLHSAGWIVFQYADYDAFPSLVKQQLTTERVHAIFRRPLPLVRMGKALREALTGDLPYASAVTENSGGLGRTTLAVTKGPMKIIQEKEMATTKMHTKREGLSNERACTNVTQVMTSPVKKQETSASDAAKFPPGSKIAVVDDTVMNVKVLSRLLSKKTSLPLIGCFDGQSSIDLVKASSPDDILLILMDWHMPGLDGLQAAEAIHRILIEQKGNGPRVYVCMVTADIEGLQSEMSRRDIAFEGTITKGKLVKTSEGMVASEMKSETDRAFTLDLVTGKPVSIALVQAILDWFQEKVKV